MSSDVPIAVHNTFVKFNIYVAFKLRPSASLKNAPSENIYLKYDQTLSNLNGIIEKYFGFQSPKSLSYHTTPGTNLLPHKNVKRDTRPNMFVNTNTVQRNLNAIGMIQ